MQQQHFGPNQLAYSQKKGGRDALAYLMVEWIDTLDRRGKIMVYNSDVSGAFDRVFSTCLLAKLRQLGLSENYLSFFAAYLEPRTAHIAVGGQKSNDLEIVLEMFLMIRNVLVMF